MPNNSILPALPTGSDVFSEAVRSVNRRGFHDTVPIMARRALLMAQCLRLAEEVGECAAMWHGRPGVFAPELVDIAIVLAQISWLTEQQPGTATTAEHSRTVEGMAMAHGELARAIIRCKSTYSEVNARVAEFNALLLDLAEARGIDIEQAIAYKLTEDEQRGHLHGFQPIAEELA